MSTRRSRPASRRCSPSSIRRPTNSSKGSRLESKEQVVSTMTHDIAAPPLAIGRPRRKRRKWAGLLYVGPAMLLVAVFFLVPLGMTVWMSLNAWPLVGTHRFIGLANYFAILKD